MLIVTHGETLPDSPEFSAAAVVLLCGWMAMLEVPHVFAPPRFRVGGGAPRSLLEAAGDLTGAAKPVVITATRGSGGAEVSVQLVPRVGGAARRGPSLPPNASLPPHAAVLVYGGNVRLRVPAVAFDVIARDYDVGWAWVGSAGPASEPPHVVQYLPEADREGIAWFLQLGASRGDRAFSPVWLSPDPPVA